MMQERDFVFGWDPKSSKRSSGLFSVLKWFGNKESVNTTPPNVVHSASSSCDSIESVFSTDTVASFAFVPPNAYKPFGSALQPEKFILPGPETSTYRARLAQREARRESDRNLTLRSKYNLYKGPEPDWGHSLPLMNKTSVIEQQGMHRRTASESSKHRRAGAYCHVKGKRKAPQPPGFKTDSTLRRKKRMAPQPPGNPDIICNDSLKLDRGILKPAKEREVVTTKITITQEVTQVSPRPWYKRTLSKSSAPEKKHDGEKRKSGLSFLTNISELDREAMEIIGKENLKMKYLKQVQAPEFMRPKTEHTRTNSDSWLSPKRKSAKDLIARFNALTGVNRSSVHAGSKESVKEQTPPRKDSKSEVVIPVVQESSPSTSEVPGPTTQVPETHETEAQVPKKENQCKSPVARTTAVVKPISRSQWNCPRCTLENDYWRIICRACSTIKPYFDDFTSLTTTTASPSEDNKATKSGEENKMLLGEKIFQESKRDTDDFFGLGSAEVRIAELQRSVFQSQYPKLSQSNKLDNILENKDNTEQRTEAGSALNSKLSEETKVLQIKSVFQPQYPKVSLNLDIKPLNSTERKDDVIINESVKPSEAKNIFQSQYPKINLNFNRETDLVATDSKKSETENIKPPGNKARSSIFDFNLIKSVKCDSNNKTEKETCKDDKKKIEKMILGDEIGFTEPKENVDKKKLTSEKKKDEITTEQKIEKMILGDEISVEKPEYINVNKYEKVDLDKGMEVNKNNGSKIERMILGDEISVQKCVTSDPQQKTEKVNLQKARSSNIKDTLVLKAANLQKSDSASSVKSNDVAAPPKTVNLQKNSDNGAVMKSAKQLEEEKQNSAKREEREKLKKMLIEMKNSLPKRMTKASNDSKHRVSLIQEQTEPEIEEPESPQEEKSAEIIIATTETIYENIKVKKADSEKPLKVSSSAQTNAVFRRSMTPEESASVKQSTSGFQLLGEKDFVGISNEKTGNSDDAHTYANLNREASKDPDIFAKCSKTDTLEINRLLRRLEMAIAGGEMGQAAVFARELAQLKVPLSVIRQKSSGTDKNKANNRTFNVDMYVEDKMSHRGPFPLQVSEAMTVVDLKKLVEDKYKFPVGVQRWILGKQLATDDNATLAQHQISSSGCPIFLYLVAPGNGTATDVKTETNAIEIVEVDDLEEAPAPLQSFINVPIAVIEEEDENELEEYNEASAEPILEENVQDLWKCQACTLLNPLSTNKCDVCGLIRDEAEENAAAPTENQTYLQLVNLDNEDLVRNTEAFECLVCLAECQPGEGVTLRECLHQFCRACLAHTVEFSEEAEVKCPYRDNQYACDIALQDREVKALVSAAVYEQHLAKSVKQAENKMDNTFHCKTPDCKGWCIFEDNVNDFHCPVCQKNNCLTCQAIHTGMNCKQYQEQMKTQSETDEDARRTRHFLEDMIKRGEALACPTCQVVLLKKWGCDWLRCSMCKTEICWVTRGPRWGPGGKGDTTGGCKCGVNGTKCHPKCNYCH